MNSILDVIREANSQSSKSDLFEYVLRNCLQLIESEKLDDEFVCWFFEGQLNVFLLSDKKIIHIINDTKSYWAYNEIKLSNVFRILELINNGSVMLTISSRSSENIYLEIHEADYLKLSKLREIIKKFNQRIIFETYE